VPAVATASQAGFLTWLPDVLRDAGIDVWISPGAETRTSRAAGLYVNGVVWHHTATSTTWSDAAVHALLRDGRRDLAGPLSQVGVERDGTWVLVALGRANHNGYGTWGNDSIGLEFYNDGRGEPFTKAQYEGGITGTRAILNHLGLSMSRTLGHKETDPERKIDPTLDMTVVRQRLIVPTPTPDDPDDDDDMRLLVKGDESPAWFITDGITKRHVKSRAEAGVLVVSKLARWNNGVAFVWDQERIDEIPVDSAVA
jgi:hypothetical protein